MDLICAGKTTLLVGPPAEGPGAARKGAAAAVEPGRGGCPHRLAPPPPWGPGNGGEGEGEGGEILYSIFFQCHRKPQKTKVRLMMYHVMRC